jgi:hypothetical protein
MIAQASGLGLLRIFEIVPSSAFSTAPGLLLSSRRAVLVGTTH